MFLAPTVVSLAQGAGIMDASGISEPLSTKGRLMEFLVIAAVLLLWFLLQAVVLPRLGVST